MRRGFVCGALLIVAGLMSQSGAFASELCDGTTCTTITGRALDPHGNPVASYVVWAKYNQSYQQTQVTGADGRFTLKVPTQAPSNCWIVGGSPDEFFTGSGVPGKVCGDAAVELRPLFRVRSQVTPKETYVPDVGTFSYHLEVYANARSTPAPFAGDPLIWTLTYHTATRKAVYAQGVFPAPSASPAAGGVTRYVWKIDLSPTVVEPTMIHVDWGDGHTFGQMMDCRMIFAGIGQAPHTGKTYLPGSAVTLSGTGFGSTPGKIVLERSTDVTYVEPAFITDWSDTRITFYLPLKVTSDAYVRASRSDGTAPWCLGSGPGLPTNKTPLKIKLI